MSQEKSNQHKWNFFKAGGSLQPSIESGADIADIQTLDMKLWAALSCPTRGVVFDTKTLDAIDTDSDGRVRHDDIVAACKWIASALKNPQTIMEAPDYVKLSDIDSASELGGRLLDCAQKVLADIGKADSAQISLADFADPAKIFAATAFNADGVITSLSCRGDTALEAALALILKACGAKPDRSGLDGIDAEAVEKFFAQKAEFLAWANAPKSAPSILFLGDNTEAAYKAYSAVSDKIDDFFTRAAVLAFDPSSAAVVNAQSSQIEKIFAESANDKSAIENLASLPIAKISGDTLPLSGAINPAFAKAAADFAALCVAPIVGQCENLARADWSKIKDSFSAYSAWIAARPANSVAQIGVAELSQILDSARENLLALIKKDFSDGEHAKNVADLEKFVRLHKNLRELLCNFVNFGAFYKTQSDSIFQYGRLYIDSRECLLCMKVEDVAKHSALAAASYAYILYCVCKRKSESDVNIAAIVTAGDSDNLVVGRNGVFYDRLGRDWDATVVKIIQNPVGLGQAFWSPYKRIVKWASEQIAKRAASADTQVVNNVTASVQSPKPDAKKIDIGTVAALGVAVGGITTAFGMILDAFLNLGYWIPLGIVGIVLAISLPSMIVAALKLRMRSIAPLLDANGWAVNAPASISVIFGGRLTRVANVPLSAVGGKSKSRFAKIAAAILFLLALSCGSLWYVGFFTKPFGLPAPSWSQFAPQNNQSAQAPTPVDNAAKSAPAQK